MFLGVVHRLDKPTSGVLLFARTSKSASRLSEQFREGGVEKVYWAVVEPLARRASEGNVDPRLRVGLRPWASSDTGALEDWLKKNDATTRVEVVSEDTPEAQFARLLAVTANAVH